MNVNVERRRRRRRKRRRAKEEEEEEEGFFVYRRDPWTKERVKVNEDGEEIERSCSSESSESDSEAHRPRSSSFSFSFSFSSSSSSSSEEEDEDDDADVSGGEEYCEDEEEDKEQNETLSIDEDDIALLAVHPSTGANTNTNTNNTSVIEDPRNYCLFRFRWCWKFDSLSWWVAMCFLFAALFCVVGSACSCFRRVTRNPEMYVRAELVPYLIGGFFFFFASALTLWASYRAKRKYSRAKNKRRVKFGGDARLREQIRDENDLNVVLFEQRTREMEPSRQMWLRENNDEWIKRTRKLELIGALLTLIGSGLFVAEIIATMVIADSAHWVTVPIHANTNSTHHGHWWYHTHFDSSEDRKQFVQMSTVVEVRTGHCGALAYLFGSWFYWCASKRQWVWNPFLLPNGAHEKISFYSLIGSWLFLIGAIMTPPASTFAVANSMASGAPSTSSTTHNETVSSSMVSMVLERLYDEMANNNHTTTPNSSGNASSSPYGNDFPTNHDIKADHARFVKGALWLFVGYVMGSVCYCVQALLMIHTIALAEQRKQARANSSHSQHLRSHLRRSHSHRRNTAV